jgi:hypothetical protein
MTRLCSVGRAREKKRNPAGFPAGPFELTFTYSVSDISQPPPAQQAPGQHEPPPPQQSSLLDEIEVALVSAMNAAIIRKYFIDFSC